MIRLTAILKRDHDAKNPDWKVDKTGLTASKVMDYFNDKGVILTEDDTWKINKGYVIQKQVGTIHYRTVLDKYTTN